MASLCPDATYARVRAPLEEQPFGITPHSVKVLLCLRVPFAVRFRTVKREEQNVQIADDRQEKSVMDADAICDCALRHRNEGSANDGHDHDSGAVAGKGTEFGD